MPCIYNIPKNEYRHCKLCSVERCDERPLEEETTSATSVELSDPYKNDPIRCKARELYGAGSIFNEERRGFIKGAEWMNQESKLSWRDIDEILRLDAWVSAEIRTLPYRSQEYCEEILKRFNQVK